MKRGIGAMQLNFHQLRIFYMVARHGSFSRAADALEISQPAVSIQVQELEKSLGMTLLHRRARQLHLTEVGETVYGYAHRIFSISLEMEEAIRDTQGLKTGHLTLGASTTPGEYILPVAIGRFRRQFPGVQVELKISNTRSIVSQILGRDLDLGMIGSRPDDPDDSLELSTYVTDEIVLVTGPAHPLAKARRLRLADVIEEGLVVREEGSATRGTAEECLAQVGVRPKIAIELGSNQAVKLAAEAGVGGRGDIPVRRRGRTEGRATQGAGRGGLELHQATDGGLPEGEAPLSGPTGVLASPGSGATLARQYMILYPGFMMSREEQR